MRQVTRETVQAFLDGRKLTKGNTQSTGNALFLFGNCIAKRVDGEIWVTNAGYGTVTTRERLNGLAYLYADCRPFGQKDWVQVVGDKPWSGGWKLLSECV